VGPHLLETGVIADDGDHAEMCRAFPKAAIGRFGCLISDQRGPSSRMDICGRRGPTCISGLIRMGKCTLEVNHAIHECSTFTRPFARPAMLGGSMDATYRRWIETG
jgi:hypothetical protein